MKQILKTLLFSLIFANAWSDVDWQIMLDEPVVISLSRCMHRFEETSRLMEEAGFTNIQRFEAIDGTCTSNDFFESLFIFKGRKGQKGCTASHILLWKSFVEDLSDKEYLFVCEDDMLPHTQFLSLFPLYWEATPKDFDIVMVGNWLSRIGHQSDLIVTIPTLTTHAYIISREGAQKLLELYSNIHKKQDVIDQFLYEVMKKDQIIYYCYNGKKFPDPKNQGRIRFGTGICFQNRTMKSTINGT